jgi:hypothetical protein
VSSAVAKYLKLESAGMSMFERVNGVNIPIDLEPGQKSFVWRTINPKYLK